MRRPHHTTIKPPYKQLPEQEDSERKRVGERRRERWRVRGRDRDEGIRGEWNSGLEESAVAGGGDVWGEQVGGF